MRALVIFERASNLSLWQIACEQRRADGFDVSGCKVAIARFQILTQSREAAKRAKEAQVPAHGAFANAYFTRAAGGREEESARIWNQK
jgi:hypothetical protein